MSDPLGLSIGTTNLVAARVGSPPIVRRAVLNLFGDRAPCLGAPTDDCGVTVTGFVDRIGDPVPLVASDGTSYHADQLVVEALDALIESIGGEAPSGQLAIAVPAHWNSSRLRAMRAAMRGNPSLAPNGVPARLVSDAVAALTALHADPGLPGKGVVALLDFGGAGTSITLADAASAFEPVATSRLTECSGDQIDEALAGRVLDGAAHTGDAAATEEQPAGTAAMSSVDALRVACRTAKEQLSTAETADVSVDLPGHYSTVRITRAELEPLLTEPLDAVFSELDDLLQRNNFAWSDVSAVAAVGGAAQIPGVAAGVVERTASRA
ncbi:MAG: Hsp70 family protein, partial [Mycobacterium sp.]